MAGGAADKTVWVLALAGAGAAAGALTRYPQLAAPAGLQFLLVFAAALIVLGLPLLLGEAALGQFRRRNVVDAFGIGPWRVAGFGQALGALLLAGLLGVLGGWAGRYVIDSITGDFFSDPARHFRLLSTGLDAVLGLFLVVGLATALALRGTRAHIRSLVALLSGSAFLVLAGLALWAYFQPGAAAGRSAAFSVDLGGFT